MAHAWKACWVKALGGSNPPSSARTHEYGSSSEGPFSLSGSDGPSRRPSSARKRRHDAIDDLVVGRRTREPRLEHAGRQQHPRVEHGVEERRVPPRLLRLGVVVVADLLRPEREGEEVAGARDDVVDTL